MIKLIIFILRNFLIELLIVYYFTLFTLLKYLRFNYLFILIYVLLLIFTKFYLNLKFVSSIKFIFL